MSENFMMYFRLFVAASAMGILSGCGEPSPWSNLVGPGYEGLTAKALSRLEAKDDPFEPFSVGLIADPQVVPGFLRTASGALDSRNDIGFSLILGDLTDRSLRQEFMWVAEVTVGARRPVLTVVGNHDGLIYGESIYEKAFGNLNYSFVYRGLKFVMWNNNPYEWGYPDFEWLRQEVESHPHIIIVAHQPPGKIERYPEANQELRDIYRSPNVLGSLHGHTHKFDFELVEGKPVMTVGRVIETTYAVMHVEEGMKLSFERCKGDECIPQEQ